MIDSVSKFSLNGTNSNGAIWKPLLTRFSQTEKKWKNLGQYHLKFNRAGAESPCERCFNRILVHISFMFVQNILV